MKKRTIKLFCLMAVAGGLAASCVSAKKYEELEAQNKRCSKQLSQAKISLREAESSREDLEKQLKQTTDELTQCKTSHSEAQSENKRLKQTNAELDSQIDNLNKTIQETLASKSQNLQALNEELLSTRAELEKRAEELSRQESELQKLQSQFAEKEKSLTELQDKLKEKQQEVEQLHNKISQALLGFVDKGLNVETKDGKVYVSMEEKLLFASGSWTVSKEGEKALSEIAAVLAQNPDINVMIEGHTDNVPMKGKNQVKDNWDLSVMRASSIAKILLSNGEIAPERVVPSGRGEFVPIADNSSAEARAKNRRSEIILTPKMDELLKMLR